MTILNEYKTAHADAMARNENAAPSQKWVELGVTDSINDRHLTKPVFNGVQTAFVLNPLLLVSGCSFE